MKKYGRQFRIQKKVVLEKLGKGGPESVDTAPVKIQSTKMKQYERAAEAVFSRTDKQVRLLEKSHVNLSCMSDELTSLVKCLHELDQSSPSAGPLFQMASIMRHGIFITPNFSFFSLSLSSFSFSFSISNLFPIPPSF